MTREYDMKCKGVGEYDPRQCEEICKESSFLTKTQNVEKSIAVLNETVNTLERIIKPVLSPECTLKECREDKKTLFEGSEFDSFILEVEDRISSIRRRIDSLIDRCTIK